jgi:hypothetical protein
MFSQVQSGKRNRGKEKPTMKINAFFTLSWLLLVASSILLDQVKSQVITGLQIVNAPSGALIRNLIAGDTISVAAAPFLNGTWTIAALSSPETKSVRFGLDGNPNFRTESTAPWTMTGKTTSSLFCLHLSFFSMH